MSLVYAFWNNKGGTGKTSLAFQAMTRYAEVNQDKNILAIDLCPQANLSELMLGGLNNRGSSKLLEHQRRNVKCSIGGYFELRLPSPYKCPSFSHVDFITTPYQCNTAIPKNIDLVCGDPLLEVQSNAVNTLANNNIPGIDAWNAIIDWIKDFIEKTGDKYDTIFIDCNPSFSLYTQIGLATADRVVLPVMADDSSRRAIQNAISLLYGISLPSEIYAKYLFKNKLQESGKIPPKLHLIIKNRLTQYMGTASAYDAVLNSIVKEVGDLLKEYPDFFTFTDINDGFVDVRDFQTTGVVAFARGEPFSQVRSGQQEINGKGIGIKPDYLNNCREAIEAVVRKL